MKTLARVLVVIAIATGTAEPGTCQVLIGQPRGSLGAFQTIAQSARNQAQKKTTQSTPKMWFDVDDWPADCKETWEKSAAGVKAAALYEFNNKDVPRARDVRLTPSSVVFTEYLYVSQVIDSKTALVGFSINKTEAWVRFPSEHNLVDRRGVECPRKVMIITGTKQYTTVLGSTRTVVVAEFVSEDEVSKVCSAIEEATGFRIWHLTLKVPHPSPGKEFVSGNGKRFTTPRFLTVVRPAVAKANKHNPRYVWLEAPDGEERKLLVKEISADDRKHLKSL